MKKEKEAVQKVKLSTDPNKKHRKRGLSDFLDSPFLILSRIVDMTKLRTSGFESFTIFVIRRAKHPEGAARHQQ